MYDRFEIVLPDFPYSPWFFLSDVFTKSTIPTLTRLNLIFDFPPDHSDNLEGHDYITYPIDLPSMIAFEAILVRRLEAGELNEVTIAPLPNPSRYDHNPSAVGLPIGIWKTRRFPENLFPKLRNAGRLTVLGIIPAEI